MALKGIPRDVSSNARCVGAGTASVGDGLHHLRTSTSETFPLNQLGSSKSCSETACHTNTAFLGFFHPALILLGGGQPSPNALLALGLQGEEARPYKMNRLRSKWTKTSLSVKNHLSTILTSSCCDVLNLFEYSVSQIRNHAIYADIFRQTFFLFAYCDRARKRWKRAVCFYRRVTAR